MLSLRMARIVVIDANAEQGRPVCASMAKGDGVTKVQKKVLDNFENYLAEGNKSRAKADSKIWRVRSRTLYDERTNSVLLSD
jgi:hypothetical protein